VELFDEIRIKSEGEIYLLPLGGCSSFRHVLEFLATKRGLDQSLVRYMRLFDSNCNRISSQSPIPDLSIAGSLGSTDSLAVSLEMFDKAKVHHNGETEYIAIVGCITLGDVARKLVAQKSLNLTASCAKQVIFHKSLGDTEALPNSTLLTPPDQLEKPHVFSSAACLRESGYATKMQFQTITYGSLYFIRRTAPSL